jgi:two-component system sensor histidine kinase/response regulator
MSESSPRANGAIAGRVLVVDDNEANRLLLQELLELEGHQVLLASNGAEALECAAKQLPDLMLLDVNMPRMDGLEVCRRVRADPASRALPIILVTALAERAHRLQGIAAGANDYVTKPIDRADLLLRVGNALGLRRLHQEVADQYRQLQELERMRDSLVHMLVHDLRSPLTGISGYLELARQELAELDRPRLLADVEEVCRGVNALADMVSNVLDVSRSETGTMPLRRGSADLGQIAAEAIASLGRPAYATVELSAPLAPVFAEVDPDVMRRVIANLVGNAVKFTPRGGAVRVEVCLGDKGPEIRVTDAGPGIPAEYHEKIFEKFGQAQLGKTSPGRSSGLGLTFCKMAAEAHGGGIGLKSEEGKGSTFWLSLPMTD